MRYLPAIVVLAATVTVVGASTVEAKESPIGMASLVSGDVKVERASEKGAWSSLRPGDDVFQGDTVQTGNTGMARLTFDDDSSISVARRSKLEVNEYVYKPKQERRSIFKLWGGRIKASISKLLADKNDVKVTTPTAVAGVRGTQFLVAVEGTAGENQETQVVVFEGSVGVGGADSGGNDVVLGEGMGSNVGSGGPSGPRNFTPEQLQELNQQVTLKNQGGLRHTVGSSDYNSASNSVGGNTNPGFNSGQGGPPPIDQEPTDGTAGPSMTIRINFPE